MLNSDFEILYKNGLLVLTKKRTVILTETLICIFLSMAIVANLYNEFMDRECVASWPFDFFCPGVRNYFRIYLLAIIIPILIWVLIDLGKGVSYTFSYDRKVMTDRSGKETKFESLCSILVYKNNLDEELIYSVSLKKNDGRNFELTSFDRQHQALAFARNIASYCEIDVVTED